MGIRRQIVRRAESVAMACRMRTSVALCAFLIAISGSEAAEDRAGRNDIPDALAKLPAEMLPSLHDVQGTKEDAKGASKKVDHEATTLDEARGFGGFGGGLATSGSFAMSGGAWEEAKLGESGSPLQDKMKATLDKAATKARS